MAQTFQVSPGVNFSEVDATTTVPSVATTVGAIGGVFRWGPVGQPILVGDEPSLAQAIGSPTNFNAETFFAAANYLAYANSLWVSRGANTTGLSNTQSVQLNSNTTITANGIAILGSANVAYGVAGPGIPANTTVTAYTANTITLSANATSTGNTTAVFFASNASFSAIANTVAPAAALASFVVKNDNDYLAKANTFDPAVLYIARYPGLLGSSLAVSVCDSASQFQSNIALTSNLVGVATLSFAVGSNVATLSVANSATGNDITSATFAANVLSQIAIGDFLLAGNVSTIGTQKLAVTSIGAVVPTTSGASNTGTVTAQLQLAETYALAANIGQTTVARSWQFAGNVTTAPGQSQYVSQFGNTAANDELHVVVVDSVGRFTGVPGSVLEVWQGVSRAKNAKTQDGSTNYYATVINGGSQYVWFANDRPGAPSANAIAVASSVDTVPLSLQLTLGQDGDGEGVVPMTVLAQAYDQFRSAQDIDISLLIAGKARVTDGVAGEQIPNYLIDNISTQRRDCVVFASPPKETVVNNVGNEATGVVNYRNQLHSTSYAFIDSGYKYQYDKYNDVYRWIPLNGDIAGLCAYTDQIRAPWWSPAGFNRGQIKNIVKLAWNPKQDARDLLYKNSVNPVVTFPGQGTILYGDKTALAKSSAFDRINVRRLFIVLEKAISTAAQNQLFEFNDSFTQAQFIAMVDPYLRDIKGQRGITDYKVVCDATNNGPDIVDANQFVGDIYIKPARSINYIQLNFVAVRSGVDFSEIVGSF